MIRRAAWGGLDLDGSRYVDFAQHSSAQRTNYVSTLETCDFRRFNQRNLVVPPSKANVVCKLHVDGAAYDLLPVIFYQHRIIRLWGLAKSGQTRGNQVNNDRSWLNSSEVVGKLDQQRRLPYTFSPFRDLQADARIKEAVKGLLIDEVRNKDGFVFVLSCIIPEQCRVVELQLRSGHRGFLAID